VQLPTVPEGANVSWANFVVRLSSRFTSQDRDAVIAVLHRQDVGAANYYPAQSLLPQARMAAQHQPGDFPVAENASGRTIALPLFNRMTEEEVDTVCSTLEVALQRVGGAARG
jgi:perosamine synthetase